MDVVISVPQQDGEVIVTFPGLSRTVLPVAAGLLTVHDNQPVVDAVLGNVPGAVLA